MKRMLGSANGQAVGRSGASECFDFDCDFVEGLEVNAQV